MDVCIPHVDQKRVLGPLEFQIAVIQQMRVLGTKLGPLQGQQMLLIPGSQGCLSSPLFNYQMPLMLTL